MHVGIEVPVRVDLDQAFLRERVAQLALDEPDAVLDGGLFVLGDGVERAAEIVEHREQLLHQPLVRARDQVCLLPRGPLAEVVEVGRDTTQVVQVLVALGREGLELLLETLFTGLRLGLCV